MRRMGMIIVAVGLVVGMGAGMGMFSWAATKRIIKRQGGLAPLSMVRNGDPWAESFFENLSILTTEWWEREGNGRVTDKWILVVAPRGGVKEKVTDLAYALASDIEL